MQHRDPVIAMKMHKAFRAGDLGHRGGSLKRVAAGEAAGDLELVGAEADAIWAVREIGIQTGCRRLRATGILHKTVLLLDPDEC